MIRIAALMKSANISATAESIDAKRIASRLLLVRVAVLPRLHDRRVQVQVVRHHGGAEDADGDVEHAPGCVRISVRGMKPTATPAEIRPRQPELDGERSGDQHDQRDDERFDVAEAAMLQEQDDQHVERGQADAPDQRQAEEQVERDRGADALRRGRRRRWRSRTATTGRWSTGREKLSRQACARSRPLAMPRRADSACSRIAIRLEIMMTLSSV